MTPRRLVSLVLEGDAFDSGSCLRVDGFKGNQCRRIELQVISQIKPGRCPAGKIGRAGRRLDGEPVPSGTEAQRRLAIGIRLANVPATKHLVFARGPDRRFLGRQVGISVPDGESGFPRSCESAV